MADIESIKVGGEKLISPELGPPEPLQRESVRGWIALASLALFTVQVILGFVYVLVKEPPDMSLLQGLYTILLPPTTGFVGAAIAFYYGTEMKSE